jgi:DNA/RNA-binding domain of Phe-tRNA-synthetase-like protein
MLLFELVHPTLRLALVSASDVVSVASPPALLAELTQAEQRVRADVTAFPEPVRAAMRDVLRVGGYKPTGRGKPASELLLALALKEGLPRIGNLVDINNLVSLESGLPISIFDRARIGDALRVRFGRPGEAYVFNASGHSMELAGLPVICNGQDQPVGNAVRDSMGGKVEAGTQAVLAVLYGSRALPEATLLRAAERLAALLRTYASADLRSRAPGRASAAASIALLPEA